MLVMWLNMTGIRIMNTNGASLSDAGQGFFPSVIDYGDQTMYLKQALFFKSKLLLHKPGKLVRTAFSPNIQTSMEIIEIKLCIWSYFYLHTHSYESHTCSSQNIWSLPKSLKHLQHLKLMAFIQHRSLSSASISQYAPSI